MSIEFVARGICVDSLPSARRFYANALGFRPAALQPLSAETLPGSAELDDAAGQLQILRNADSVQLALLQLDRPATPDQRQRRPNNQVGLTHLAFWVEDIEHSARLIAEHGGQVYWQTRALFAGPQVTMLYATDPVGTRIELMQRPGGEPVFSHSGICSQAPEQAAAFYAALGFAHAERFDLQAHSAWLDVINELEQVRLCAQMMRDPHGATLEILQFHNPPCIGAVQRPALNSFGFNFLLFRSHDLPAAAQRIQALGGRLHHPIGDAGNLHGLACSDPDGVRLEILRAT